MKAKVELEIDKEDLSYELTELVSKTAKKDIKEMVAKNAETMVKDEVAKYLVPLTAKMLMGEEFNFSTEGYSNWTNHEYKRTPDDKIKSLIKEILNSPSYKYSKTAGLTFDRYHNSSSGGEKTSLIHHIITDMFREHFEKEIVPIISTAVNDVFKDMGIIKEAIKEQLEKVVASKISEIKI